MKNEITRDYLERWKLLMDNWPIHGAAHVKALLNSYNKITKKKLDKIK